jgi:hypothetical protein
MFTPEVSLTSMKILFNYCFSWRCGGPEETEGCFKSTVFHETFEKAAGLCLSMKSP